MFLSHLLEFRASGHVISLVPMLNHRLRFFFFSFFFGECTFIVYLGSYLIYLLRCAFTCAHEKRTR